MISKDAKEDVYHNVEYGHRQRLINFVESTSISRSCLNTVALLLACCGIPFLVLSHMHKNNGSDGTPYNSITRQYFSLLFDGTEKTALYCCVRIFRLRSNFLKNIAAASPLSSLTS